MEMRTAKNLEEALRTPGATWLGGATDFMPLLKNQVRDDENLVLVGKLPELLGIAEEEDGLHIGAAETLTDIASSELIKKYCPALAQAADCLAIAPKLAPSTQKLYEQIRQIAPVITQDTPHYQQIAAVEQHLRSTNIDLELWNTPL